MMLLLKTRRPRTRRASNFSAGRHGDMRQIIAMPTMPPTKAWPTSDQTPQPCSAIATATIPPERLEAML